MYKAGYQAISAMRECSSEFESRICGASYVAEGNSNVVYAVSQLRLTAGQTCLGTTDHCDRQSHPTTSTFPIIA